ncbi:unnamed protein product, partial [Polarella glacialis]
MLVFIVLTNHLIACAFYGIATIPGLDTNWAYYAFELTGRTSWLYRYTTSYHWAMGLFHTSGSDILPTNSAERIFVQFVLIWNLAVFSTLIASIGNALQQLRELNEERTEQFAKVRRYFNSNNVQSGIAKKTWAALSLAAQKPKRRTHWDEIKILQHLPKSLQAELHRHIREPILCVHPFFSAFARAFRVQMQQIYQLCISEISTEQGQELFQTGEASTQMYFVMEGTFCYVAEGMTVEPSYLSTGQWVGEPVLWMSWKHTGRLLAKTPCAVLAVKSKELQEILGSEGGDAGVIVREYAMQFTRHCHNHSYHLTDVGVEVDIVGKLVELAFEPPQEDLEPPQEDSDAESSQSSTWVDTSHKRKYTAGPFYLRGSDASHCSFCSSSAARQRDSVAPTGGREVYARTADGNPIAAESTGRPEARPVGTEFSVTGLDLQWPKFLSLADRYASAWTGQPGAESRQNSEEQEDHLQLGDRSTLVSQFMKRKPSVWAALLRPEYHTWHTKTKRFHKELSESLAAIDALESSTP